MFQHLTFFKAPRHSNLLLHLLLFLLCSTALYAATPPDKQVKGYRSAYMVLMTYSLAEKQFVLYDTVHAPSHFFFSADSVYFSRLGASWQQNELREVKSVQPGRQIFLDERKQMLYLQAGELHYFWNTSDPDQLEAPAYIPWNYDTSKALPEESFTHLCIYGGLTASDEALSLLQGHVQAIEARENFLDINLENAAAAAKEERHLEAYLRIAPELGLLKHRIKIAAADKNIDALNELTDISREIGSYAVRADFPEEAYLLYTWLMKHLVPLKAEDDETFYLNYWWHAHFSNQLPGRDEETFSSYLSAFQEASATGELTEGKLSMMKSYDQYLSPERKIAEQQTNQLKEILSQRLKTLVPGTDQYVSVSRFAQQFEFVLGWPEVRQKVKQLVKEEAFQQASALAEPFVERLWTWVEHDFNDEQTDYFEVAFANRHADNAQKGVSMLHKLAEKLEELESSSNVLSVTYLQLARYYAVNETEGAPTPHELYSKGLQSAIYGSDVNMIATYLSTASEFCQHPAHWAEIDQLLTGPSQHFGQEPEWQEAIASFQHTKNEEVAWYMADQLTDEGKYETALEKIGPYLDPLWKELTNNKPSADKARLSTVFAALHGISRYQETLEWVRAAQRMETKRKSPSLKDMIMLLNIEASTHKALKQPDSAIAAYRKALELVREKDLSDGSQLQETSLDLASAMAANGQTAEAEKILLETFAQVERVLSSKHLSYSRMLHALTVFYMYRAKQPEKAEALVQAQIPIMQKARGDLLKAEKKLSGEHQFIFALEHLGWLAQYAYTCQYVADDYYAKTGQFQKGRDLYRITLKNVRALSENQLFILQLADKPQYGYIPVLYRALTYHLSQSGDMKEIRALLQELIKAAQKWSPEEKNLYSPSVYELAELCQSTKCYTEATALYKKLMELLSPQTDDTSRAVYLHLMERLATAYESANEPMKAVTIRAEAMALEQKWW